MQNILPEMTFIRPLDLWMLDYNATLNESFKNILCIHGVFPNSFYLNCTGDNEYTVNIIAVAKTLIFYIYVSPKIYS